MALSPVMSSCWLTEWYAAREGKALVNFGASAGHIPARMAVMKDSGDFLPRDAAMNRPATQEEQRAILASVEQALNAGALGVGLGLSYTPTATPEEILDLFYSAAKWKRPVFVHMRRGGSSVPGVIESLQEVIADAAVAGVPLHIVHIGSMATKKTREALRMIESARARGLDVTTEAYPYIASMTGIQSAAFNPGWQDRLQLTYSDLLWPATGERLTPESFERYRRESGFVIMFMNSEEMVRTAIAHPLVMIASDGVINDGVGHPRGAGTYSRVLGKYVREEVLSLMDAIRKSSLMPAERLESMAPQMRQKGRLKAGADADISVFDPARVIDKATYERPAQYSEGFRYVMVGGTFVVHDGKLRDEIAPGQAIRAQ
jgi:N-acyl-D-aspartate/D-glutamate deacylase